MKIIKRQEGQLNLVDIENSIGLKATFCSLGASIYEIWFNDEIMTLTPSSLSDFAKSKLYHGKTIGAIANRVRDGKIKINDKEYQLFINEGKNALHGGKVCLSNSTFDEKCEVTDKKVAITYTYLMKDMRSGLPGDVEYKIIYTIEEDKSDVKVELFALSNKDTIVALTNHSYFCLGSSNLGELSLTIPASKYIKPNPADLLPLSIENVNNILDFRKNKPILQDIYDISIQNGKTKGYDHHFFFDKENSSIILENKKYQLAINSSYIGCQIYSDNYPDEIPFKNTKDNMHRGIAIEPQDSIMEREILKKDTLYQKQIIYSFIKK